MGIFIRGINFTHSRSDQSIFFRFLSVLKKIPFQKFLLKKFFHSEKNRLIFSEIFLALFYDLAFCVPFHFFDFFPERGNATTMTTRSPSRP